LAYVDASYGAEDGHPTYEYLFMMGGTAVASTSRRMTTVPRRTGESEYCALSEAAHEAAGIRNFTTSPHKRGNAFVARTWWSFWMLGPEASAPLASNLALEVQVTRERLYSCRDVTMALQPLAPCQVS
jgi:hypothetical protein